MGTENSFENAKSIRQSLTDLADVGEREDSNDVIWAFESGDEEPETTLFEYGVTAADELHSEDEKS